MEQVKLEIAKIVGTPSPGLWSQVHTFIPEDSEKLAKRGRLLAVISLKSAEAGVETVSLGREILSRVHEEYFGNLSGTIFERLKSTLEKIGQEWPETDIIAGVVFSSVQGEVFYVGTLGQGKIFIKRKGTLKEILSGGNQKEVQLGSGLVKIGDVLLLGSQSFFELVSEGVIKASLGLDSPQEMVESLAPMILGRQDFGQAAAVICSLASEPQLNGNELPSFGQENEESPSLGGRERQGLFLRAKEKLLLMRNKLHLPSIRSANIRLNRRRKEGKDRNLFFLTLFLIFLFMGSLLLGIKRKKEAENKEKAKILFSLAQTKYQEAKEAIGVDTLGADQLFQESINLLKEVKKISSLPEAVKLEGEIAEIISKEGKDRSVGEIPIFFDLGLIKEQARATAISRFQNQLAILDRGKAAIYLLDLEKKASKFIAEPRLATAEEIYLSPDRVYILTEEGVLEMRIEEKKSSLIIPKDKSWGKIISLGSFAENFYLLDQEKKMIWQHVKTGSGYSPARAWLSLEDSSKIGQFLSFAIDGSIWALESNGKILRFVRGKKEAFVLKGVKADLLTNLDSIYTDEDSKFIYLLSGREKQIMVFSKEGLFQARFRWSGQPENPIMMTPWEEQKKIFIIKENSIFNFSTSEVLR